MTAAELFCIVCRLSVVSKVTLPHTCLYPQSSVAFMILPTAAILTSWPPTNQSKIHPKLAENLAKFSQLHHKRYVFVTSPLIGFHEQAAISFLQDEYLMTDMQFLPMHSSKECVEGMQNITKLCSKQLSALVRKRMESLETQLVSEEAVMSILKEFGLAERECVMVMDGCGGLAGLARVSEEELMDLNLEHGTIKRIMDLLHA